MPTWTPIADRFWPKVDKRGPDECWPWLGAKDAFGYGRIGSGGKYGRALCTHRVAYELANGPIPEGLVIDHLCANPNCVNPAHLEPVTQGENVDRAFRRLSQRRGPRILKTHCPQGHPYSGDNLHINPKGHQVCKQCSRERVSAHARKRRAERRALGLPPIRQKYTGNGGTHCQHGHPLSGDNLYVEPATGKRCCRECARRRTREYRARRSADRAVLADP